MARGSLASIETPATTPGEGEPQEVPESQPGETGTETPDETGKPEPEGAAAIMARAERTRFAALKIDLSKRKVFAGSVTTYPQEVVDFVESLYEAFQLDPDWWYPVTLDSPADIDVAVEKARAYGRDRQKGRLVINCRREQGDPATGWFRASGYTKGKRAGR